MALGSRRVKRGDANLNRMIRGLHFINKHCPWLTPLYRHPCPPCPHTHLYQFEVSPFTYSKSDSSLVTFIDLAILVLPSPFHQASVSRHASILSHYSLLSTHLVLLHTTHKAHEHKQYARFTFLVDNSPSYFVILAVPGIYPENSCSSRLTHKHL